MVERKRKVVKSKKPLPAEEPRSESAGKSAATKPEPRPAESSADNPAKAHPAKADPAKASRETPPLTVVPDADTRDADTGNAGTGDATENGASPPAESEAAAPVIIASGEIERPNFVVGIGASAGGLASIETLFHEIPAKTGIAFVLIQHLSRDHKSLMSEIMLKHTKLAVAMGEDGAVLQADHLYLIPPGKMMRMVDGKLRLTDRAPAHLQFPIDVFFQSLAEDYGPRSAAVVLSGTGSDGTHGIRFVKNVGGLVLIQDDTAQFDGMPRSAISTGLADDILPADAIARKLISTVANSIPQSEPTVDMNEHQIFAVLNAVKQVTGINFEGYRRKTLLRRIQKRLWLLRMRSPEQYVDRIKEDSEEVIALSQELMIGVTSFFRDPEAFDAVRDKVLPQLFQPDANVRVWVVGCSTGEEAYSLAILFEEYIRRNRIKANYRIFATDIDDRAIAHAGRGVFPRNIAANVEPAHLDSCFSKDGDSYKIATRIRERIVFAKHDISKDPPFTKVDLVTCRNLLIYQQAETQRNTVNTLQFALREGRYLWLGPSESLGMHEANFTPINGRWRLFKRSETLAPGKRTANSVASATRRSIAEREVHRREATLLSMVCSSLAHAHGEATIVVGRGDTVLYVFGDTKPYFSLQEGRPAQTLQKTLSPHLAQQVSAMLKRSRRDALDTATSRTRATLEDGSESVVEIASSALKSASDDETLYVVQLHQIASVERSPDDLSVIPDFSADTRINELEGELGEVKNNLQVTIEELESSNEELQSANEELIASNEELQSTNEELHSVNEELHTVNAEYQRKLAEQHILTADMEHLLQTTDIGTIFLDASFRVRRYTPAIARLIPLMPQDRGRPVGHIKHQLVDTDLEELAHEVQGSAERIERHVHTPDGATLMLRAVPYHDYGDHVDGVVITFVDISALENARHELAEKEHRFRQVAANIDEVIWIRDKETGDYLYLSPVAESIWGRATDDLIKSRELWRHAVYEEDRERLEAGYNEGLRTGTFSLEYRIVSADGQIRWLRDRGFPIRNDDNDLVRVAGVTTDITASKQTEDELRTKAQTMTKLALRDALTGLLNRRGWEAELLAELQRSKRHGESIGAILIDCDDFKSINDSFGHSAGDQVLREIATQLSKAIRPSDLLARIGGDEFVAILPSTRNAEALRVAERMRTAVAEAPIWIDGRQVRITVSLGVNIVHAETESTGEVLASLHQGLSSSKRHGKNRVATTHSDGVSANHPDQIARVLRSRSSFRVFGQTIRDVTNNEIVGYELLSRGPRGNLETPDRFFQLAREFDMLTVVDTHCLTKCLEATVELLSKPGAAGKRVHLNVYPSTLMDTKAPTIRELFQEAGALGNCCLEISEQQVIGEPTYLRPVMNELRDMGFTIAVDDVGFGRSSLESLIVLEPDTIKIDRAFVMGAHDNVSKRRCLERLLTVAHGLKTDVIAEGAETREDADLLLSLGVRFAQGYYWDKPCPIADVPMYDGPSAGAAGRDRDRDSDSDT